MAAQKSTGPRPEGAAKPTNAVQPECMTERREWGALQQRWEAQWQAFLKTLQSPHSTWEYPGMPESAPWEDAKAFLASFEQVAKACWWPRGEWAALLLPALSGEAEEAFRSLEAGDQEDYGKVKAAILRGDALKMEAQRQRFRQFCCEEVEDPRRVYSQLQELCHQWLKPERRSKEQILELLILEQFLASLPPELQGWIRAGGPETCSQAVALAEEFLRSQQEAKTGEWQGPLQEEESVASLGTEKGTLDAAQGEAYQDTKQNQTGGINVLGSGMKCPSHSSSLLPPEGQEMAKAGLSEGLMTFKETGAPFHMVEWTPAQPGQQTMFWEVLQEVGGSMQSLGVQKGSQLKVEDSQYGGEEPEETPRTLPEMGQGNVPVTAVIHEERCEQKRCLVKLEKSLQGEALPEETNKTFWSCPDTSEILDQRWESKGPQETKEMVVENECWEPTEGLAGDEKRRPIKMEEPGPEETHGMLADISERNILLMAEIRGQRCESKGRQGEKPVWRANECRELAEGLTGAICQTSTVQKREDVPFFSKYNRRYHYRSERVVMHTDRDHCESPMSGANFQQYAYRNKQGLEVGEKENEVSEYRKRNNLTENHSNHTGMKPYICPMYGESFRPLKKHQGIHSDARPHECSSCGRCFFESKALTKHQIIHTGVKPYKCSQCGKCFRQRVHLKTHERIHTGEKPYKCSQCGKSFSRSESLMRHQRIHTGEKPYGCSQCGKCFRQRQHLIGHQRIHSSCGKYVSKSKALTKPQVVHTGVKPYKCSQCGKCFRQRIQLKAHEKIHTGEKPYECLECGKSFSRSGSLIRHQKIHTREKMLQCSECGRGFCRRDKLIRHQRTHGGQSSYKMA
ncbi:zinc finger protein 250-like isoform X1 [Rhineura floridana]|uniref:zinc finger protein 250-like isoform X1 n=1 Tax=Rhineura floridana TaxID=261503 RepID=UPI002AC82110|nr:zinc finger protein 250-like isoform X1 [Rhineura floridana]XP_061475905.1 zinc finger protein 250-like isoform X1 [Rhineura floridana]XP_061475906.1 zinc finger protein 250-like isoform X1 [Rhineura floridana]